MLKKSKMIKILCSAIIGVLLILMTVLGLNLGGAVVTDQVEITVSTEDLEALYDGTPLTNHKWSLVKGALKPGHSIKAEFNGAQTMVGQCYNSAEFTVVDSNGKDVTNEYKIKTEFGSLVITPRMLTISSASNQKEYDGLPLRDAGYTISENCDGLVQGHTVAADIVGEISMPGYVLTTINSIAIYDENGVDVTRNYQLTIKEGLLGIVAEGMGMTIPGSLADIDSDEDIVLYMVKGSKADKLYLKTQSFGNYNGKGWDLSPAYEPLCDDKYSAYYLTSLGMKDNEATSYSVEIKPVYGSYTLPYYTVAEEGQHEIQLSDTIISGNDTEAYTINYYRYKSSIKPTTARTILFERKYKEFVHENYLAIDDETRAYMDKIIDNMNFGSFRGDSLINSVAQYIQTSAIYNMDYDRALDSEENIAVAFLDQYKEGVCRHYASAAVLLYRALGIPARYTVGTVATTKAGEWVSVTAENAHAWVEVYMDGLGWIQVEVTGASSDMTVGLGIGGNLKALKPNVIKVKPTTAEKKYDGTVLNAPNTVTGLESILAKGYTYKAIVSGSQKEIGISQSVIESLIIYDESGKDVTKSFNLKIEKGRVHVYSKVISFESRSYEKQYDGMPLEAGKFTGGEFESGHTYTVVSTATPNAGYRLNTYNVKVLDKDGNDVTYRYKVVRNYGIVNISRVQLTIKAEDAEKRYDGKPLTCNKYSIVEGSLVEGERIATELITGSQTEVGRSDNIVSQVIILSKDNKDVTENYEIKFQTGKLKVTY